MSTKKRGSGTRDLGLNQNGKGSADRTDRKIFVSRFPKRLTGKVDGFIRQGSRLVKVYGARGNEVRLRPVIAGTIDVGHSGSLANDLAVAQKMADDANASFRAAGFDTQGH